MRCFLIAAAFMLAYGFWPLAVKTRMVPRGMDMAPYRPGRGAGIMLVVSVVRAERHPRRVMRVRSLLLNLNSAQPPAAPIVPYVCLSHRGLNTEPRGS